MSESRDIEALEDEYENWEVTRIGEHIRIKQGEDEVYIHRDESPIVRNAIREVEWGDE